LNFTSADRDEAAKTRAMIMQADGRNARLLKDIEKSMFVSHYCISCIHVILTNIDNRLFHLKMNLPKLKPTLQN
jgi:hypothetical protein